MANAQDTVITISPGMYNSMNEILISTMDGWRFKEGNDTTWSKKEIDLTGWKKLRPTELSSKMADKNGRLEGWFRLKIKTDPAFKHTDLGVRYLGWGAADIYMDGILIQSHGNTGINGKPFKEFNPSNQPLQPLVIETGVEHLLAIHFVDDVAPFPPYKLKSEDAGLERFIRLFGPAYYTRFSRHIREWPIYSTLSITVCVVLSLLFWLLAFLNKKENILLLCAVCVMLFSMAYFCNYWVESNQISFALHKFFLAGVLLLSNVNFIVIILIAGRIFNMKISGLLKMIIALSVITGIVTIFLNSFVLLAINSLVPLFIYTWYASSSWRRVKGAQWAIIVGLLGSSIFSLLFMVLTIKYQTTFFRGVTLITTIMSLAFPLSLLAYVSILFKEIIKNVELNAKRVVQLSEEKREQAVNQQELLREEVAKQTFELRASLENLKSTQAQLIQSEKMASLGELTAGIAHEIQNPLNFVNNFSEVSNELITEMKDELAKGNLEDANEIADDVQQNLEKINHHGKRAADIVKGMLQHSRSSSSGVKEPTDINALCDEYLRLSYHGLRAKDKSFNATMKTDFDATLEKISIIPQDIGRVVLNLINNAFYAVVERSKAGSPDQSIGIVNEKKTLRQTQGDNDYEPTVTVSTKKQNGKVEIRVVDNGNGIPQKVLDKIFQPFFTTKPTGQGTGLGLSLSYDIVKAHGGELKVETKEGEGATFIIQLPIS